MLGAFNILPLLKGWDYKDNVWTRTIKRGQRIVVESVNDLGLFYSTVITTNDCYGGVKITGQGADLRSTTFGDIYPKLQHDAGLYMQDPNGYNPRYYRPNPQSSAGLYITVLSSSGAQGTFLPYIPATSVELFLLSSSTQEEATVSVYSVRVVITNRKQFIKSLRSVIGSQTITDIDPALLSDGPQEMTLKGKNDKKTKEEKEMEQ